MQKNVKILEKSRKISLVFLERIEKTEKNLKIKGGIFLKLANILIVKAKSFYTQFIRR